MNTLELGYRGREYPVEKPSGVFRILVLGDSMIFGSGVLPEETIPAQMERILNHKFSNVFYHVINISQNGHSAMDLESEFKVKGEQLNPDLVIPILCENDAEVIGVEEGYINHCQTIWNPNSDSWPFFYDSVNRLMDAFSACPYLMAYYGIQSDNAVELACKQLIDICKKRTAPFLNLQEKVLWIPRHRQIVSKADGHPSSHLHRVAAVEICRHLIKLGYLPIEEMRSENKMPDLSPQGVSPEWKTEEVRAWCSYRRDSNDNMALLNFIENEWVPLVTQAYQERQIRIMEYWRHETQNQGVNNWRWYRKEFVSLNKGMKILSVNRMNDSECFLSDVAFYRDEIHFDDKKIKEIQALLEDALKIDIPRAAFMDNWYDNAKWVLNQLIELKTALNALSFKINPSLADALFRLENRWNAAAKSFYKDVKLFKLDEYRIGFRRTPLNVDEQTAIEIRLSLITKNADFLNVVINGKGSIQSSILESSYTFGDDNPQYILFKFPLMDLFSCEVSIIDDGLLVGFEYRINRSPWRKIELSDCQYQSGNNLKTPYLPAFL
ncbi:MAG: SGNH/GDSL hydrolase family protein [Proteobacteria bacterium]|nr:SGNH/GDSL hydrolase family protein [Desulfobacula sp.]MBU3952694.1 SGNH/GDSL hydrolase family protein [Pseudomonadota bacterium]MBU4132009.1 SGNH/GDSL hydrolase family protein [Pseudomonadota bacterium]